VLWVVGGNLGTNESNISTVDLASGTTTTLSVLPGVYLSDIAWSPGGQLYAADFDNLYRVDSSTGLLSLVGNFNVPGLGSAPDNKRVTGLTFTPQGDLLMSTYEFFAPQGSLFQVNTTSGQATLLGQFPNEIHSSGDLAYLRQGLYMASANSAFSDFFLTLVDAVAPEQSTRGPNIPASNIFAIASTCNSDLYAGASNAIFEMAPGDAAITPIATYTGPNPINGFAFQGEACASKLPPPQSVPTLPGFFLAILALLAPMLVVKRIG
jgi:hypothetical protein